MTLNRASIIASLHPNTNTEGLSDYELLRLQKIQRNEAKLASLGLCGITSKKHNNNSGSSGIGGDGTNDSSGRINEYKAIVDSEAYLPFHSPPPVPRHPSKPRQFLHPTTQTDNRDSPGPGWTIIHDDSFCRTWISPTRKIQFDNIREAFQFEELRKHFGNNEDVALEEYQNLKDLVTPNDNTIATKSNSSSKWREMKSDDVDVDSCYICDDGGGMFKLPCLVVLSLYSPLVCISSFRFDPMRLLSEGFPHDLPHPAALRDPARRVAVL